MDGKKLNILIIDDDSDNLSAFKNNVSKALPGTEVLTALDVLQGLELAKIHEPDVILVDVSLSKKDGLKISQIIKKEKNLQIIPMLFITDLEGDLEFKQNVLKAGADAFLVKPIDDMVLITQLKVMAKIKERNILISTQKERLEALVEERTKELRAFYNLSELTETKGISQDDLLQDFINLFPSSMQYPEITYAKIKLGDMNFQTKNFTESIWKLSNPININELEAGIIEVGYLEERPEADEGPFLKEERRMLDAIAERLGHTIERFQKQKEIEFISKHDYLTDLYNRRYYFEQFKQHDKPEYYPLGVMMLDVNCLKIINDAFGHKIGDNALKMVGNVLKEFFEQKYIVSRIGGDEFAVFLPNITSTKLQKYKDQIASVVKTKRIENVELSIAIGFELKINDKEDVDEIIKLAENHMYHHKTIEGSSFRSGAINAILQTLTEKYEIERSHSIEVSDLCKQMGQQLKLRKDEIKDLEQAGMFHDIGKISIPDIILNKPGKLTNEEYDIIKTHTEVGYQILRAADEYSDFAVHALHHHERWDGKGYPRGLKGNKIPLFSRIIGVVDDYEAMTSDRPYRKKMTNEYAISEIKKCSGTQFDPKIAKLFVERVLTK